jgi:uncharacterized protein
MNQSSQLYQLQGFDLQLDKIDIRQTEIENLINSDKLVRNAKIIVHKKKKLVDDAAAFLRKSESVVKSTQIRIETNEASLYGGKVRNPKELQDLQSENSSLKRRLATQEDDQIEAMLAFEQSQQDLVDAEKQLVISTAESTQNKSSLSGEQNQLIEKKRNFQFERDAILSSILPANLAIYQKLRERKNGIGVVSAVENACSACGATIRPALLQESRSPQKMAYCSSCSRILYAR